MALRDAIDIALAGQVAQVNTFTNDGEGYEIIAGIVNDEIAEDLLLPYTDEAAKDCSPNPIFIYELCDFDGTKFNWKEVKR